MTEQKINAIREACIKANPEIVKLEFGCEVKNRGCKEVLISKPCEYFSHGDKVFGLQTTDGNREVGLDEQGYYWYGVSDRSVRVEILGRPIRLADVLVMTGKITEINGKKINSIGVNRSGGIFVQESFTKPPTTFCFWNLLKNDLRLQSPECIDFLYNLLSI